MEATDTVKPELSVILPAMRGAASVRAALDSWLAQPSRERVEILLLCPDAEEMATVQGVRPIPTGTLMLHEARALGVRRARANHLLLAEDHCLPEEGCLGPIIERVAEGWDLIGPAMRPGDPGTLTAQACFLIGYGEWMEPAGGPTRVLPGYNLVIRRSLLLDLGDALASELFVASLLIPRFRAAGRSFFLEERWRMRHYDPSSLTRALAMFWYVGLAFGAARSRDWAPAVRGLYPLAAPAAAARHWLRGAMQYARVGRSAGVPASCLPLTALLALAWGAGEGAGAVLGLDRIAPFASRGEVKPVAPSVVTTDGQEPAVPFRPPRAGLHL